MAKRKGMLPPTHGSATTAGMIALANAQQVDADRRLNERTDGGKFLAKITPEEWEWAIEQIRSGNTDANICRHLGLNKGAIATKRRQDPVFAQAYSEALEDAFVTIAQETRAVARGDEGYSSGDVQRDRLIVETDLKLAAKFARKILGDKLEIEQKSINIVIRGDSDDLC